MPGPESGQTSEGFLPKFSPLQCSGSFRHGACLLRCWIPTPPGSSITRHPQRRQDTPWAELPTVQNVTSKTKHPQTTVSQRVIARGTLSLSLRIPPAAGASANTHTLGPPSSGPRRPSVPPGIQETAGRAQAGLGPGAAPPEPAPDRPQHARRTCLCGLPGSDRLAPPHPDRHAQGQRRHTPRAAAHAGRSHPAPTRPRA